MCYGRQYGNIVWIPPFIGSGLFYWKLWYIINSSKLSKKNKSYAFTRWRQLRVQGFHLINIVKYDEVILVSTKCKLKTSALLGCRHRCSMNNLLLEAADLYDSKKIILRFWFMRFVFIGQMNSISINRGHPHIPSVLWDGCVILKKWWRPCFQDSS